MNVRIYVPRDTSANACGADEVAAAIDEHAQARGIAIELVRNGSRGMCWLEPLVEVESPEKPVHSDQRRFEARDDLKTEHDDFAR